MLSKLLWLSGSIIYFILGCLHLYYTFFTDKLHPRDKRIIDAMKATSPRLSTETNLWRAWTGFNASHSAGAIFIGLFTGGLAIQDFSILENSFFLSFSAILTSVFYLWLAKKYWFTIPFICLLIATACFILSPVSSFFT